ncbi:putative transcriptional regulatory protein YcbL [Paenibacillus nasutitermitis]|uniref:Transcriptional regulatory protein YcbL n=2 Tax=Paenibacillus nasutitermitis TaxID=1652958 RepID=A0A916ZGI1_9BACL|nr:putative transcriptional regulatory protein YcbL [Paenibacillus nasutitermitis]
MHVEQAGLQVIEASSGRQAIQCLQEYTIELVILDLMMDDGNGFEVLHYLRETHAGPLVIALSARREVEDKILTLGLGADDYVTKPFSPVELVARMQAQLRRHRPHSSYPAKVLRLNKLVLDIDNYILRNDGKSFPVTPVECRLLEMFMQNPDRVLTKREIYKQVWNHENFDDNNLSVFISKLRSILEPSEDSLHYLHSIRGIGYRFSGDGQ